MRKKIIRTIARKNKKYNKNRRTMQIGGVHGETGDARTTLSTEEEEETETEKKSLIHDKIIADSIQLTTTGTVAGISTKISNLYGIMIEADKKFNVSGNLFSTLSLGILSVGGINSNMLYISLSYLIYQYLSPFFKKSEINKYYLLKPELGSCPNCKYNTWAPKNEELSFKDGDLEWSINGLQPTEKGKKKIKKHKDRVICELTKSRCYTNDIDMEFQINKFTNYDNFENYLSNLDTVSSIFKENDINDGENFILKYKKICNLKINKCIETLEKLNTSSDININNYIYCFTVIQKIITELKEIDKIIPLPTEIRLLKNNIDMEKYYSDNEDIKYKGKYNINGTEEIVIEYKNIIKDFYRLYGFIPHSENDVKPNELKLDNVDYYPNNQLWDTDKLDLIHDKGISILKQRVRTGLTFGNKYIFESSSVINKFDDDLNLSNPYYHKFRNPFTFSDKDLNIDQDILWNIHYYRLMYNLNLNHFSTSNYNLNDDEEISIIRQKLGLHYECDDRKNKFLKKENCIYHFLENDPITDIEQEYYLKILEKIGYIPIHNSEEKYNKNYYNNYGFDDLILEVYKKIDDSLKELYNFKYSIKLLVILLNKHPLEFLEILSNKYKEKKNDKSTIDKLLIESSNSYYTDYIKDIKNEIIYDSEEYGIGYNLQSILENCETKIIKYYSPKRSQGGGGKDSFITNKNRLEDDNQIKKNIIKELKEKNVYYLNDYVVDYDEMENEVVEDCNSRYWMKMKKENCKKSKIIIDYFFNIGENNKIIGPNDKLENILNTVVEIKNYINVFNNFRIVINNMCLHNKINVFNFEGSKFNDDQINSQYFMTTDEFSSGIQGILNYNTINIIKSVDGYIFKLIENENVEKIDDKFTQFITTIEGIKNLLKDNINLIQKQINKIITIERDPNYSSEKGISNKQIF